MFILELLIHSLFQSVFILYRLKHGVPVAAGEDLIIRFLGQLVVQAHLFRAVFLLLLDKLFR